jgi:hypothetical protein
MSLPCDRGLATPFNAANDFMRGAEFQTIFIKLFETKDFLESMISN